MSSKLMIMILFLAIGYVAGIKLPQIGAMVGLT